MCEMYAKAGTLQLQKCFYCWYKNITWFLDCLFLRTYCNMFNKNNAIFQKLSKSIKKLKQQLEINNNLCQSMWTPDYYVPVEHLTPKLVLCNVIITSTLLWKRSFKILEGSFYKEVEVIIIGVSGHQTWLNGKSPQRHFIIQSPDN